jgi:hypothetical protein
VSGEADRSGLLNRHTNIVGSNPTGSTIIKNKRKRYQECGFFEKLHRRKAYLKIPRRAMTMWVAGIIHSEQDEFIESFKNCWSIAQGIADGEMDLYFFSEEVMESIANRKAVKASQAEQFRADILMLLSAGLEKKDARVVSESFEEEDAVLSKNGEQ